MSSTAELGTWIPGMYYESKIESGLCFPGSVVPDRRIQCEKRKRDPCRFLRLRSRRW